MNSSTSEFSNHGLAVAPQENEQTSPEVMALLQIIFEVLDEEGRAEMLALAEEALETKGKEDREKLLTEELQYD